ncbi:hypothetical protein CR513_36667, partial [Mucuna pruriens]
MEQAIEELEQQNAEMRAEMRIEMGQMKEQMNKMFEIITRNAAPTPAAATPGVAPSTATSGTPTHPPGFTPPVWNATMENPPAPQEQPAGNNSGAGRGQGSRIGPFPTLGATVYFNTLPEAGRVPGTILESALLGSEKINVLEEQKRVIEGTGGHGIDAANLCLVPNIELPSDFKVPKFEKYKGSSCPRVHLAMYCRKMAPYTQQDKILMHCFQDSLSGAALRWYVGLDNGHIKTWRDLADAFLRQYKYNEDMAPDRSLLQNLSKTDTEGFKDYAQRWRELAAQVQPPLSESEMASMFIDTLPSPFYGKVVRSVASNFADLVTIGERIEAGIKRGRFAQDWGSTSFAEVANTPEAPNPRLVRQRRVFTLIPLPYSTLFPLLLKRGMIAILPLKSLEPPYPRSYDPNAKCDYHSGAVGHSTHRCWSFKHKVQDLIDARWLRFKGNEPNISTNPLPAHEGQSINTLSHNCDPICPAPLIIAAPPKPAYENNHAVPWHYDPVLEELPKKQANDPLVEEITNIAELGGITHSGRIYTPENLGKKNPKENPKGAPKEKEAGEFLKLIRYSEYELLDYMNKTPAHISLLSLLLNSESHRNLLLRVLKDAHVAPDITAERFGGIIGSLTSSGRLTFSDEEIPAEGRQHNQPLHIAVKCGDYMITKVLIDNGSSLNILPKATLDKLGSIHVQLKASPVIVRAFDGSRRDVMG